MALQFLDSRVVGAYIVDAWQNHFQTELDPADGQWFTNGPGNNGGLYGKLTDSLASDLIFDATKKVFSTHLFSADSNIVDNRNGLQSSVQTTLSYQYANSSSVTHSSTNGLKVGSSVKISSKFNIGVEVGVEASFSTEYSYSWTDSTTSTTTETQTVSRQTTLQVPTGKVYQQVLTCNKDTLKIPFTANIYLNGVSCACFGVAVNGQKIWQVDAGTLCDWINQFGSAGDNSFQYGRDPNQPQQGYVALQGVMTAEQSRNFMVYTLDITDSYTGGQPGITNRVAADISSMTNASVVSKQPA